MKMQKSVVLAKKYLKINIWKRKKYCKVWNHCHYAGEYTGFANDICNLKYRVPKKIPTAFHNESNYDYNFIIKKIAEEYKNNLLV